MKYQLIFVAVIVRNLSFSVTAGNLFNAEDPQPGLRGRSSNQKPSSKNQGRSWGDQESPPDKKDEPIDQPDEPAPRPESRIIGGTPASQNEYPFAVSLQDKIGHFCGGSLIARDVVLSAAHCKGGPYNVAMGRRNLQSNQGQEIAMQRELPHPSYNDRTTDQDYMLVFLKTPATLGNDVKLIKPNKDSSSPSVGRDVTVVGWGDTDKRDEVSKLSDVLMEVKVNVISNQDCDDSSGTIDGYSDSYKGQITQNMLCAKTNRKDSCQGDSGGPLVQDNTQVGVVSWGIGCASDHFPGVYARVSKAHAWIQREVCKGSDYADEAGFDCSNAGGGGGGGNNNKPPKPSNNKPSKPSNNNKPQYDDDRNLGSFGGNDNWDNNWGFDDDDNDDWDDDWRRS